DDEELAVGAVGISRPCRTDDSALERHIGEFGRQIRIFRAAGAIAPRIARLRHEAVDDAMEFQAVVEAFPHELLHPLDMLRRDFRQERYRDLAGLELEDERVLWISRLLRLGEAGSRREGERQNECKNSDQRLNSFLFGPGTWAT